MQKITDSELRGKITGSIIVHETDGFYHIEIPLGLNFYAITKELVNDADPNFLILGLKTMTICGYEFDIVAHSDEYFLVKTDHEETAGIL